jgi:hypothetical protein
MPRPPRPGLALFRILPTPGLAARAARISYLVKRISHFAPNCGRFGRLEHFGFGFVSDFELRISDLPGLARPIGFVFWPTRVFGPKTPGIGFVWRAVHTVDAYLASPTPAPVIEVARDVAKCGRLGLFGILSTRTTRVSRPRIPNLQSAIPNRGPRPRQLGLFGAALTLPRLPLELRILAFVSGFELRIPDLGASHGAHAGPEANAAISRSNRRQSLPAPRGLLPPCCCKAPTAYQAASAMSTRFPAMPWLQVIVPKEVRSFRRADLEPPMNGDERRSGGPAKGRPL